MNGKLKPGWKIHRFDRIAQNIAVRANPAAVKTDVYVGLEHLDPETIHLRKWGHPSDVTGDKLEFKKGDVIFGRRRAYQRKLAIADRDGICSAHAMVLRAKPDVIVPEFLPFFIQSDMFMERAISISVGSLSPTVNWKTLALQEFPLPPIEEQKRMAEILWAADDVEESYYSAYKNVEATISLFLQEWFCRNAKIQYNVKLESIAEVSYGLTLNANRRKLLNKKPYLRVANVQRNFLSLTEVNEIGCSYGEENLYRLEMYDILVVEGHANINEIGRAALWNGQIENCLHQNHLLKVRCSDKVIPQFIILYFNSIFCRKYFQSVAKTTSGLYTINSSVLKKMIIPIVSMEKQNELVKLNKIYENTLSDLIEHYRKSRHLKQKLITRFIRS